MLSRVDPVVQERTEAIKERDAVVLGEKKLLHDLDPGIRGGVGNSAKALSAFGMEPTKERAPLSPEDRLIAKSRAAATRDGLGTRGNRQRQAKLDELRGKPRVEVVDPKAAPPPATPPTPPAPPASTEPVGSAKNTVVPPPDGSSPLDGATPDSVHP